MSKNIKVTKEEILNAACDIVLEKGINALNVRSIATRLHSSVQPIYYQFSNFGSLKEEVYNKAYNTYKEMMFEGSKKEQGYKHMGLAYINFAKKYPEYFKMIFTQTTDLNAEKFMMADTVGDEVVRKGQVMSGLSYEEQKEFHIKIWIFTHGIASLLASKTIKMSDSEIEELLVKTTRELLIGYKKEGTK